MMHLQLRHIKLNAPPSVPPGQQRVDTFAEVQSKTTTENTQTSMTATQPTQDAPAEEPPSQEVFENSIKEFAQDIVLKQQQMEALISKLPGLNVSEEQQIERMKALERELENLEGERMEAVREKEVLLKRVEEKIMGVGRVRT